MLTGTIEQIWRYPVKSMAGERLGECSVDSLGIPGDRGWALRSETSHEITNGKRIPLLLQCAARYRDEPTDSAIPDVAITLPDRTVIHSDDPAVNARLSEVLGYSKVIVWS